MLNGQIKNECHEHKYTKIHHHQQNVGFTQSSLTGYRHRDWIWPETSFWPVVSSPIGAVSKSPTWRSVTGQNRQGSVIRVESNAIHVAKGFLYTLEKAHFEHLCASPWSYSGNSEYRRTVPLLTWQQWILTWHFYTRPAMECGAIEYSECWKWLFHVTWCES